MQRTKRLCEESNVSARKEASLRGTKQSYDTPNCFEDESGWVTEYGKRQEPKYPTPLMSLRLNTVTAHAKEAISCKYGFLVFELASNFPTC